MKYKAFISYRHCRTDSAAAKKIINIVETYGIPKTIIEKHHTAKRVGKLFRDEDELSASANLSKTITNALDDSEYLIMLCSPEYLESEWCMLEFNYWMEHKSKDSIIVILLNGEPETAFPEKLSESGQPLAIDIRGNSEKEILRNIQNQKLRIVAALIGCDYDDLRQRDKEQARQARAASVGAILSVVCAFSVAIAFMQSKANERLNQKNIQIEENLVQISDQNREINNQNEELEAKNNQMKLLNANICLENAAFLAEKNLYDSAAKKVLEGYELCKDMGDEQLLDKVTYQLAEYMDLYDPDGQMKKLPSMNIEGSFLADYASKGTTLMISSLSDLKFYDILSGELKYSYKIPEKIYATEKVYLLTQDSFMTLLKETDGECLLSIHNINDGSSVSYNFGEEVYVYDTYFDDDSIFIGTSESVYEFDYSCNLINTYNIVLPEGEKSLSSYGYNKKFIINESTLLLIDDDRMIMYDFKEQKITADILGENNFLYGSSSATKNEIPDYTPGLYGDCLFYLTNYSESNIPALGMAEVAENKLHESNIISGENCRIAFCEDDNKLIVAADDYCYIINAGENMDSIQTTRCSLSLSDDDYVKKVVINGNMAGALTNNGKVHIWILDGDKFQNYFLYESSYNDLILGDEFILMESISDYWDYSKQFEVYSYNTLENVENYLSVSGVGELYGGTNLDGLIRLKLNALQGREWIFDADTCELLFSNEYTVDGYYRGFSGTIPFVSGNRIISINPSMYSVNDFSSLPKADGEEPDIIYWEEKITAQTPSDPDSTFSYKFSDEEYIYFLLSEGDKKHGEKYSLADGSLAEVIEFLSPHDDAFVYDYYVSGDVRVEILSNLSNYEMVIYQNNTETARYENVVYGDYSIIDSETIEFAVKNENSPTAAIIYSLAEQKELCRIEEFNGSENFLQNVMGTGCDYFLVANRYLMNTKTFEIQHDFGGTFINSPVDGMYYNEYLGLMGFLSDTDLMFYDPESYEHMFTVRNCCGAAPDGKYVFTKSEPENMTSFVMKIKLLNKEEIIQKAREKYSDK